MDDNTCFIERSSVREIVIGVSDEHVHVTEGLLRDIDALPITTKAEMAAFTPEELNLLRQWFNAVEDLNVKYLEQPDLDLYRKIQRLLGVRVDEQKTLLTPTGDGNG